MPRSSDFMTQCHLVTRQLSVTPKDRGVGGQGGHVLPPNISKTIKN